MSRAEFDVETEATMNHLEMYEMEKDSVGDWRWARWVRETEKLMGIDLDGNEATDGYSMDSAYEAFLADKSPLEYAGGWRPFWTEQMS